METLTADAAKAAGEAAASLKAVLDEKGELAGQIETLKADAAKAAEEAKTTIEGLKDKVAELTDAADFGKLDAEGLKGLAAKLIDPQLAEKLAGPLEELGFEILPIEETEGE